jgi:hypothetical protein
MLSILQSQVPCITNTNPNGFAQEIAKTTKTVDSIRSSRRTVSAMDKIADEKRIPRFECRATPRSLAEGARDLSHGDEDDRVRLERPTETLADSSSLAKKGSLSAR